MSTARPQPLLSPVSGMWDQLPTDVVLPTDLDLPDTDGKPVDNEFQILQAALLTDALRPILAGRHPDGTYYVAANNGIYWRLADEPLAGCKVPDWFYVPGVVRRTNDHPCWRSYVMWQHRIHPVVVMEFISEEPGGERDQTFGTGKFWVYEHAIRPAHYVIFDPFENELEVYRHVAGRFVRQKPGATGRYPIPELGVQLGPWEGSLPGMVIPPAFWIRWWDANGQLLPTAVERAEAEATRAEAEKRRAEAEAQRAERLAEKLRAMGIDPGAF